RRSCFDDVGPFSTASRLACDYAKWVEIAMRYEVDFVQDVVFEYTQHRDNLSRSLTESLQSRTAVFRELLEKRSTAEQREAVQHIIFNLNAYLALSAFPSSWPHIRRAFSCSRDSVSFRHRLSWLTIFIGEQVRLATARASGLSRFSK